MRLHCKFVKRKESNLSGEMSDGVYSLQKPIPQTFWRRPFRLADAYLNLSGHNCYTNSEMKKSNPINIPSSRFLRPYSKKRAFLDGLKLKRITNSMNYAAKHGLTYHLWWHPHNFGANISENFSFLEKRYWCISKS